MSIVNKAIAKASDLASEAGWNAQQRIKVSTEEKRLEDLRVKADGKRAQIGEEMFRLWQAHKLPPSQFDSLFYELQDLVDAVLGSEENLAALKAQSYEQATTAQSVTASSYAAAVPPLPLSPLGPALGPATAPPALGPGQPVPPAQPVLDATPEVPLMECPGCHGMARADRNFCGSCGHRLH